MRKLTLISHLSLSLSLSLFSLSLTSLSFLVVHTHHCHRLHALLLGFPIAFSSRTPAFDFAHSSLNHHVASSVTFVDTPLVRPLRFMRCANRGLVVCVHFRVFSLCVVGLARIIWLCFGCFGCLPAGSGHLDWIWFLVSGLCVIAVQLSFVSQVDIDWDVGDLAWITIVVVFVFEVSFVHIILV
jgi:hypothetical protein